MELTENQKKALETRRSLCVTAGAGAGKTHVLVERYLRLLEGGSDISQILALTFTEKAAAEMKERVRKALSERPGETWKKHLEEFNWCSISTFHSFCADLIRRHPLESGTPPRFQVLDDVSAGLLKEEAFQSLLRGDGPKEVAETLVRALTHYGSWRLQERLDYMYDHRAEMAQWLEMHRTPDALKDRNDELAVRLRREKVENLETDEAAQKALRCLARLAATHSGDRDSGEKYLAAAGPIISKILSGGSDEEMVQCYKDLNEVKGTKAMGSQKCFSPEAKAELVESFETVRTCLDSIGLDDISTCEDVIALRSTESLGDLILIYDAYSKILNEAKRELNSIDFGDMIEMAHRMVVGNEAIVAKLRQRYRYLLVDEFQDTDPIQSFIVWAVAGDSPDDRLFIVGDPKQSIYGFRNADVAMFQHAKRRLVGLDPEAAVHLDTNFRSSPQVVGFVNHAFSRIMSEEGRDYQFRYERMLLPDERKNDKGSVELLLVPKSTGGSPNGPMTEPAMVAARIADLLANGQKSVYTDACGERCASGRMPGPGDMAILLRARTHLKLFEKELRDRGIPFHVHKGLGFFERQEVLDAYNLLGFLADTTDDVSLYGLLRSPYFAFSDEELFDICRAPGADIWHRLRSVAEIGSTRAEQAYAMLDTWSRMSGRMPVAELLRKAQTESGIYAVYAALPNGEQQISNIEKLSDMLREPSGSYICTPHQAIDWIEKAMRLAKLEGEAPMESSTVDAVNIMTVHASKGLEFPIVFVPEMGQGRNGSKPSVLFDKDLGLGITVLDENYKMTKDLAYRMIEAEEDMKADEESKRLLYVAMTRARDHLVLSGQPGSEEERKVVTWMDLLLLAMPGNRIDDNVELIKMAEDASLAIVRPGDIGAPSTATSDPKEVGMSPELLDIGTWQPLPRPRRRINLTYSGLSAFESYPERFIRRNVNGVPEGWLDGKKEDDAALMGTATHEVLRGRDPAVVLDRLGLDAAHANDLVQALECFERSIALKVQGRTHRELKFMMEIEGHHFTGAIDRLDPACDNEWLLTDFKTDAVKADDAERSSSKHADQLRTYTLAASKALKTDVDAELYFTKDRKTVVVSMEPGFEKRLEERVKKCMERVRHV